MKSPMDPLQCLHGTTKGRGKKAKRKRYLCSYGWVGCKLFVHTMTVSMSTIHVESGSAIVCDCPYICRPFLGSAGYAVCMHTDGVVT